MSIITIMDEDLANKIAAGEVIEKTMNVVKELVENAIDAHSTSVKIELEDSGVKSIKITDDGVGMSREDASLAFSRHATSKLKTLEDLFHIHSLGFRGEALPSIAAISHLNIKTSNGKEGTIITIHGGKVQETSPYDLRKGTAITVNNLFYNTPVRLKYLKSLYTELANIVEYINKMALSYPNIKFTLTNNDKMLLNTDGSGRLLKVINDIYGLDVTKKMIEVSASNNDYELHGYISYPELMKSNRNAITTLVNGRVIKNNDIIRMISDSYHTYLPSDKYPIVVLDIKVDPLLIDVNVHPTKMDIKFSKAESLRELIEETIQKTLRNLTLIPDASTSTVIESGHTKISNHYSTSTNVEFNTIEKEKEYENFEKLTFNLEVKEADSISKTKDISITHFKEMYPVGLVHGTYIVAENEDGMFLIDQHAANERINYEYYLNELTNPKKEQMELLIPIQIELPINEYIILKENYSILENLGFEFEEFGFGTIIIRVVPIWLNRSREEDAIRMIIDIIIEKESFNTDKFFHNIASSIACKASIRANDFITIEDMRILLTRLKQVKNPFSCPHGRPTIITYSKYDLERLFKRAI